MSALVVDVTNFDKDPVARDQARMQRGVTWVVTPLNLSEVKFSGSTFGSCTTVTAQFSSFVHQCGCSQL